MAEQYEFDTGDARVDAALARLRARTDERFKDLEDAMRVQVTLERKAGGRIKEHAELLASHHDLLSSHEQMVRDHQGWMRHVDAKLNALTDILMRREGGPEAPRM